MAKDILYLDPAALQDTVERLKEQRRLLEESTKATLKEPFARGAGTETRGEPADTLVRNNALRYEAGQMMCAVIDKVLAYLRSAGEDLVAADEQMARAAEEMLR